ncbi:Zn-ribbon domain-containing protein [Halobacteria archaeon HArc-gm2]|nr:Zn-ribbon domain-containing protein [Halobacteria archaeon HArc-gm2]
MPHQCTDCSRVFDDGSKEMLSGCPNCGGNKFQFKPAGSEASVDTTAEPPEPTDPPDPAGSSSVARTVGKTAATVRDLMSGSDDEEPSVGAPDSGPLGGDDGVPTTQEDTAQASARSDIVSPDELPSGTTGDTEHRFQPVRTDDESDDGAAASTTTERESAAEASVPAGQAGQATAADSRSMAEETSDEKSSESRDRPDLEELRAELNDQFESIKVLSPGQYELNLMELYDREEYIVALQEDGRYSIQVPENFRD